MYAKTIKYTDYNGVEKTKQFYFHLTQTEITRMDLVENGGILSVIRKMINEDDNRKIVEFFEEILLSSYGEKSADGEHFVKNAEVRENFKNHPAYDVLFMEILQGGEQAMADFIRNVVPADVAARAKNAGEISKEDILDVDFEKKIAEKMKNENTGG